MFENLKAFIRHGKQANEFKKKPLDIGAPTLIEGNGPNYQTTTDYLNLSNLPSNMYDNLGAYVSEESNSISSIPVQYEKQMVIPEDAQEDYNIIQASINQNYTDNNIKNNNNNTASATTNNNNDNNNTYNTNTNANANANANNKYQDAATQIVEQENIMRQKETSYPKLDNYIILEQMGEGAFSVVYKAQSKLTGGLVAIKILRKFQMDQAQKQSVLKEVTIMRQLNNENIVKFIEFIDSDQYYYIVQELAIGGEIFTAIVKYTYLSEDLSRHVIQQVASAIRYLHEEVGIVHRDVKPENILYVPIEFVPSANPIAKLRKSDDAATKKDEGEFRGGVGGGGIGQVKLADFGLSKQIWEQNTKTPCGTVGYTAPEIVRDEKYSKEVDMWAIGCVLYTLLCGFPPFYDERIESLTEKVARGEYTFLSPWWDEISPLAKNCVSKLLTVDPSKRYTIDEFMNDPWMKLGVAPKYEVVSPSSAVPRDSIPQDGHPVNNKIAALASSNGARYSKKYINSGLYSPAAVALRDAFDISAALHRMGEEAALSNRFGSSKDIQELVEEEEEEERNEELVDTEGRILASVPRHAPRFQKQQQQQRQEQHNTVNNNVNLFDLNLGGASILERRKKKHPINI